jgi:hypothetical protein
MFPAIWDLKKNLTLVPVTVTEESLNFSAGPFELFIYAHLRQQFIIALSNDKFNIIFNSYM